jgi:hypothetical protein
MNNSSTLRPHRLSLLLIVISLSVALAAATNPRARTSASSPLAEADNAVQAQMRNVTYRFTDSTAVHIKSLDGDLAPVKPAASCCTPPK